MYPEHHRLRKELHQFPELSGAERETAQRIVSFISEHHPPTELITGIGGYGLAFVYDYPAAGPTVMICGELDALPIQEPNEIDYRSRTEGISHKCGHDGHMSIVAGVALRLRGQPFSGGRVVLFFQSAEETGKGAGEDCPALHHAEYGFPEALIASGVRQFGGLITAVLS